MKILVTGAGGFVGKNLCSLLRAKGHTVFEWELDTACDTAAEYCRACEFVFHLAGINRPKDEAEFIKGNRDSAELLLKLLTDAKNTCPIMLSSSIQACLTGRYAGSKYGESKLMGERLLQEYGRTYGVRVLIYRFTNLFGKWCRPNYNSVVATFCHNIARDLPITVNDPNTELELLYIDDLMDEMLLALSGKEHRCEYKDAVPTPRADGEYCYTPATHKTTLGGLVDLLYSFKEQPKTLMMPQIPKNSLAKKLYSTYLSYLPPEKARFSLKMNCDHRGSFTELLKTEGCGQFSVNVSAPGITKGEHWHHTKWEFFMVVSGEGLIRQRRIDSAEIIDFYVSGKNIEAVHMLPGYTHNIINLSKDKELVTLMWANESFDPDSPDTYFLPVEE